MREPAAVAEWEPLGRATPCKKASARVAAPRELIEDAVDAGVPASEADAKRPADAKPRSTSACVSRKCLIPMGTDAMTQMTQNLTVKRFLVLKIAKVSACGMMAEGHRGSTGAS